MRNFLSAFFVFFALLTVAASATEVVCVDGQYDGGRRLIRAPVLHVNFITGSDTNCGSEAEPKKTVQGAINELYFWIDAGGGQATIVLHSDVIGKAIFYGQPTGTNFFRIKSAGESRYKIIGPIGASFVIMFGDNAEFGLENVEVDSTLTGVQTTLLFGHQQGVFDGFAGVVLTAKSGDVDLRWDSLGQANINNGLTFRGTRYRSFDMGPNSILNFNGPLVSDGAHFDNNGQMFTVASGAHVILQGNVDFVGSWGSDNFREYYLSAFAILRNMSNESLPGYPGAADAMGVYTTLPY